MGKMKKFIISGLLVMFSITLFGMKGDAITYNDLLTKYENSGYKDATSKYMTKKVGDIEYVYAIGNSNLDKKEVNSISNIFYKDNKNGGRLVRSVYGGRSGDFNLLSNRDVWVNSTTGNEANFKIDTLKTTKLVNPTTGGIVKLVENGPYILEFHLKPSEYSETIQTDVMVWNATNETRTYGVDYGHDAQLGFDDMREPKPDDYVPVYAMGKGRGMFIQTDNPDPYKHISHRLNYTMERYPRDSETGKRRVVNFTATKYSGHTSGFPDFEGGKPDSPGNGDEMEFDISNPIMKGDDSAIIMKMNPYKVKPGESNGFTFYTGIEEGTSRPLLYPDEAQMRINQNTPSLQVAGDWYEFENKAVTIEGKLHKKGSTQISQQHSQSFGTEGEGRFEFNLDTQSLNSGEYVYDLLFKNSSGVERKASVAITIVPRIVFYGVNTITGERVPHRIADDTFGLINEEYETTVPGNINNNYIIDKNTPNLQFDQLKMSGRFTEEQIRTKQVRVLYYSAPTLTLNQTDMEIEESTNEITLTGTWHDDTKSGGKIMVEANSALAETKNYSAGSTDGNWEIKIPKNKLKFGDNTISVSLQHNYSDVRMVLKEITVHRKKHVRVDYLTKNASGVDEPLPANVVTALPKDFDERIGEKITLTMPEFLGGFKYKFNPIGSGINSGFVIEKNVTADLNTIKVYYDLNQVPVEIQYNNIETGKAIFAGLDTTTRKPAKPLGLQIVGTDVNTLIQALDKEAKGYDFHSIKVKKGNTDVQNGQVGDEPTVITILFTPKFNIEPPVLNFGRHKLSVFDTTKTLEGNPEVKITNTRETAAGKITPWKVTGNFSGFKIGTQTELASELKFGNASFNGGNEVTIDSVAVPTAGEKKIPLNSKMKLDVTGGGTIVGDYEGTMTWTLTDAL